MNIQIRCLKYFQEFVEGYCMWNNINKARLQQNKVERMSNHIQYSQNMAGIGQPMIGSPRFAGQNYQKGFDKTLPSNTLKHYSSNPNLSMEINHQRPQTQASNEFSGQAPHQIPKNTDFRSPNNGFNYPLSGSQVNTRGSRSELTKSLIISDMEKHQTPEETPSPKKQLFRNIPKRSYRMSQTIEDMPREIFGSRRQEPNIHSTRQINFLKNKQEKDEKNQQKKQLARQAPAFLSRVNSDMKRSLVVQPSSVQNRIAQFQAFKQIQRPKNRRVSVQDFVKIKQLGNGKYGRVYLVKEKYSNFVCALKVIEKKLLHEQQITDQFIREVKIQMFLNHPNIIKMYGCFHDTLNIYIILQVGTGGQLYHQLKKAQPLSEAKIAFIMRQVCEAVNQIHSLRIIHRDIKPQNIVLHDNIIKLCDFGWSVHQDNKLRTTFCGTPLYVCPQILKGRQYDEKIDIWSIGIMMYQMVVGENPFKITKEEELIKIVKDEIKIPSYLYVSAEVRDFLDKCLQKNPNDRASIKELVNHPFFKKHQEKNDKTKMMNV